MEPEEEGERSGSEASPAKKVDAKTERKKSLDDTSLRAAAEDVSTVI